MARPRRKLDTHGEGAEVLERLKRTPAGWERERLLAVKLGLNSELSLQQIAEQLGRGVQTIINWFKAFRQGGLERLLSKGKSSGRTSALTEEQMALFKMELEKNKWRTGGQAYAWLKKEFGVSFHPNRVYVYLKKLGARLKVPRPSHRKKDLQAVAEFQENLSQRLIELELPKNKPLRLWIYDEARYGLAPVVRRVWTSRGTEVVCPVEKRYQWGYVFGALQVGGGGCEFLLSPRVCKEADRYFLAQIAQRDPGAVHVVIGDGAGFHHRNGAEGLPENIRLITLPPYSPELNPVEKLWDLMKDALCHQCFNSLDECEQTITNFLKSFWQDARKSFSLIGRTYLTSQLNVIS